MAELTGFERYELLHRTADLIVANTESLATCLTREEGKIISEARIEVERAAEIVYLSAEEAKRLDGEVVPLEGGPGVKGKFGFTMRVPCGVVAAVTPFTSPCTWFATRSAPPWPVATRWWSSRPATRR